MRRARFLASASLLVTLPLAGIAACEDSGTFGIGSLSLDSGRVDFDARPSPQDLDATVDAPDAPDATDPDAGDGGADAGDGGADAGDAADPSTYPGVIGSDTSTISDDTCPQGQVMIGLGAGQITTAFYAGVVSAFSTRCGTPVLPGMGTSVVSIAPGAIVPVPPQVRGVALPQVLAGIDCPANQVVVGLTGSSIAKNFPPVVSLVASVFLRCAPLSYAGGVFTVGAVTTGSGVGSGGTSVGPFDCAAGSIAVGTRNRSGDVLNGVETRCLPPTTP